MKVVKELGFDQVGEALREAASVVNVIGAKKANRPAQESIRQRNRFAQQTNRSSVSCLTMFAVAFRFVLPAKT
jgi:hypothetical protein